MNKVQKLLRAIGAILRRPYLLNKVLDDDAVWGDYLAKTIQAPPSLPVVPWADIVTGDTTVTPLAMLDGGSLPTDHALLRSLAARFPACRYFEIGTWRGESAANVAQVAASVTTVHLTAAELRTLGYGEEYIAVHEHFSRSLPNVQHITGNSQTLDFTALGGPFDMIFIDGDHHFDAVLQDTRNCWQHLTHENSIIVWHDYAYDPTTPRPEVLAAIWQGTPAIKRPQLYHVAHTLCAVFLPQPVATYPLQKPAIPTGHFDIEVRYRQ